jgi:hypothetical protein
MSPSSAERRKTPPLLGTLKGTNWTQRLDLYKGPKEIGVILRLPEEGNGFSVRNVVFSII